MPEPAPERTPPDDTTTAEIVRWTTDGKPNVAPGDKILDEGEMQTVEAIYVETINGSPWMHVSLRDPRRADTGLPVHAAEFSGSGLIAVCRSAPPDDAMKDEQR